MKKIFLITCLLALSAVAQQSVENSVEDVDKPNQHLQMEVSSTHELVCSDTMGNSFKVETWRLAKITEYSGEDLYEGGDLKLLHIDSGFRVSKTIYELNFGGVLIISKTNLMNRVGDNYSKTSAKLIKNEKTYYFNCN